MKRGAILTASVVMLAVVSCIGSGTKSKPQAVVETTTEKQANSVPDTLVSVPDTLAQVVKQAEATSVEAEEGEDTPYVAAKKAPAPKRQGCGYPLYGNVQSLVIQREADTDRYRPKRRHIYKFNKRGDLVSMVYYDGCDTVKYVWKYDSRGNMIECPADGCIGEFSGPPGPMYTAPMDGCGYGYPDLVSWRFRTKYDSRGNTVSRVGYNGDTKVISEVWKYNSRGDVVSYTYNLLSGWLHLGMQCNYNWVNTKIINKYNSRGDIIEEIKYTDGRLDAKTNYTYNSRGALRLIKKRRYGEEGYICYWKYDSRGNLIEEPSEDYYSDACSYNLEGVVRRKYDSKNRLLEEILYYGTVPYDSKGNLNVNSLRSSITAYNYDSQGNKTEELVYDTEGKLIDKETWQYDSCGNEIEYVNYIQDGTVHQKRTCKYDSSNKKIEETEYLSGWYNKNTYKYDRHGNPIEKSSYCYVGEELRDKCIYKYDSYGNILEEARYSPDDKLTSKDIYQYDSHGNLVKVIRVADGKEQIMIEYIITYRK